MKINYNLLLTIIAALMLLGCTSAANNKGNDENLQITEGKDTISIRAESVIEKSVVNSAAEILAKKEVPVLCYHRIEEGRNDIYSVSPDVFASHLQILADSGYNSVLPNELYDYLVHNAALPDKPFMITFDDSRV